MEKAQSEVSALTRRLPGIRDAGMAAAYVRKRLYDLPCGDVAEILMLTVSGAEVRDPRHMGLLQTLSLALAPADCDPLREAVAAELRTRDQHLLALSMDPRAEGDDAEDPAAQRIPDFGNGRPLSLGERKSLARRNDRDLIDRVLRDPHPDVITILLGNPALTETNVVRLCARRPVNGSVLREVFRNARWIVRYQVKLTILLNPHAPVDICLQLAPMMTHQDLQRVMGAPDLRSPLREACRRVVETSETVH